MSATDLPAGQQELLTEGGDDGLFLSSPQAKCSIFHMKRPAEINSSGHAYFCPSWWAGAAPGCPISHVPSPQAPARQGASWS